MRLRDFSDYFKRIHAEYHNVDPDKPDTRIDALTKFLREQGFDIEIATRQKRINQGLLFVQRRIR